MEEHTRKKSVQRIVRAFLKQKEAGILEAPPKMVESILDWVAGCLATEVLVQLSPRREKFQQRLTGPHAMSDPKARAQQEENLRELDKLEKAALYLGGKRTSADEVYYKEFPLDLRGWKFQKRYEKLLEERREKARRLDYYGNSKKSIIAVRLWKDSSSGNLGEWSSDGKLLTIWGLSGPLFYVDDMEKAIAKMRVTVQHELQHLSQTLLREITGSPKVYLKGMPLSKEVLLEQGLSVYQKHCLKDTEFHMHLKEEIEDFQARMPVKDLQKAIQTFVGSIPGKASNFFSTLKMFDQKKWRVAVREFTRHPFDNR
jgi:hypothetical protein